jgi:serine/threonine protein kinase
MALQVGVDSVVAGFRVKSLIGQGAMGAVYLAEDTATGAQVALKVLAPELSQDERFRQRFLRESQLAASLDSAHAVRTIGSGEENGVLYLAMAYVVGSDLRRLLQDEGRLEPARAIALVGQVAEALDAAHRAGLVHRDVKPGNILLDQRADGEQAFICDFGLARHVSSVSSLTGDRGFVGTIDYVPPEQIEGRALDGRADVYSLGCVLYECLAGRRPFARESELSVVFAHLHDAPASISGIRRELPTPFDDVFTTALAKSPDDRFATCGELAAAATAALQGKALARPSRQRRRGLAAAGVLVAVGVALGGILATRNGNPTVITQTSIGGARVGLSPQSYRLSGSSGRLVNQPQATKSAPSTNWPTLVFDRAKVDVVFGDKRGPTRRATIVTTWNRDFRTSRGIGPCSTVAALLKAYGTSVRQDGLSQQPGSGYNVGRNLYFSAAAPVGPSLNPQKYITAVALFDGGAPGAFEANGSAPFAGFVTDWETPKCRR